MNATLQNQPIRDQYFLLTNQNSLLFCVNQSETSPHLKEVLQEELGHMFVHIRLVINVSILDSCLRPIRDKNRFVSTNQRLVCYLQFDEDACVSVKSLHESTDSNASILCCQSSRLICNQSEVSIELCQPIRD